jgi:hypothetical protein
MNIEKVSWLIENGGTITIGQIGPVQCAAIACDEESKLAALVKRENESILELLQRLDTAIVQAWEEDLFTDEIHEEVLT